MSRAARFVAIIIIWLVAAMCHFLGIILFAPGTSLYQFAEPAVGVFVEEGWREGIYLAFTQYVPMLLVAFSFIWAFASEYEAQKLTSYRPGP